MATRNARSVTSTVSETVPLGFRTGGSTADLQAGLYWAAQMRLAGVKNLHLEPITMDAGSPGRVHEGR